MVIWNNKMGPKVAKYLHYWYFLSCCVSITEVHINVQRTPDKNSSINHTETEWHSILVYIQQDATLHSLFYLETALHVSGSTITH